MPEVIVDGRFVVMTSGQVLSCVLHGCDSGHIVNRLRAVQRGDPGPEVSHYVQTGRIHRIEQRRKRSTVTVNDRRIAVRKCCLPFLSPDNRRGYVRATWFDVQNLCVFGVGPEDVNADVRYPGKSGVSCCRPFELSVDVPCDKIRTVDRNVGGCSAIPHDSWHLWLPPFTIWLRPDEDRAETVWRSYGDALAPSFGLPRIGRLLPRNVQVSGSLKENAYKNQVRHRRREDLSSPSARRSRGGTGRTGEAGRGADPFRLALCPGPRATPDGDNAVLVSAKAATPTQSRTSFSASLGTTKDARKIGKGLFPVHRKATISSSAASNV
jgi:hypothetical protein